MKKYAILSNPGHNRVYFESSKKLSLCELTFALNKISCDCFDVCEEYISDIFYITFKSKVDINENDIYILSKLSFTYAIFEIISQNEKLLFSPITKTNYEFLETDLSTILKYSGKTNELFTKLMINIGVFSLENTNSDLKLLDPIAGKGTTLYEGLIQGINSYGIEINEPTLLDSYNFMKKYLENKKLKHTINKEKVSGENKNFKAIKHVFNIFKTKDNLKNKFFKQLELVYGNSIYADKIFKKNFFDLIIGDLPYGIQHSNKNIKSEKTNTRNSEFLLTSALPAWSKVLKTNGIFVMSFNSFVMKKNIFKKLLEENNFKVFSDPVYNTFEHRVDQAIKRDIIIAKKLNN